jgi:hypothetical protein
LGGASIAEDALQAVVDSPNARRRAGAVPPICVPYQTVLIVAVYG